MSEQIPIITIDGPSGSGKGSISVMLAKHLGYHLLDSGALYRLLALAVHKNKTDIQDHVAVSNLAINLDVKFREIIAGEPAAIILDGQDVTSELRKEYCGNLASEISSFKVVRESLYELQRSFVRKPGLVADGRDMGTVVFKEAPYKFYLTASQEVRAERRLLQLKTRSLGNGNYNIEQILEDIKQRDFRDTNRPIAPLRPAEDAVIIDSSGLTKQQVFEQILATINTPPYKLDF